MSQNVISIIGAHRSGTSMLTRLLHCCGLELGPEKDMMPAAADNPDGFWENLRFVKLNDEILNALGGGWDLPPREEEAFAQDQLQPKRAKAQLLIESFASAPHWGWKDPRTCLCLPFWQNLLPHLKTIVIVRNPLETAYSMHKRNGTSYALGLRLWEIYNRRLIAHTRPETRVITQYQFFFEHAEAELRRIASFAGLPETGIEKAASLVTQTRRHTSFTMEQLIDAGASEQIVALYRLLIAEAPGEINAERLPNEAATRGARKRASLNHPSKSDEADQLDGVASRLNVSIPDGETVRQELAWRRGAEIQHREEIARSNQEIARRDGRIAEMEATIVRIDQMLQRERAEGNAQQLKLGQMTEQRSRDAAEIEKIRERFIQTNHLLHSKSISLGEYEARNATLAERLRKELQVTKKLVRLLEEVDRAADRLRHSRRWKMANPLAWLVTIFSRRSIPGFGHLDKVVETYRQWRSAHPELAQLDEAIQALRPREASPASAFPGSAAALNVKPSPQYEPPLPTRPIEFPVHEQVEVSIIIPVFNQFHFTQACLASVQEHHDGMRLEVVVVDDCSTDATGEMIGKIPGIVYLRNEANSGFIASCNRGAEAARGTYLVFLNNDTVVTPGWLSLLLETFQFEPRAGLVGSKLIFPDGRLQEAGGIIWRDATGWNRGKFQDPEHPEYNYLCEVDYCSAASLMIPKSLFERLGGFDSKFAPGYYEDTDLAFKVHEAGWKVLYQPLSKVIHYEGATGGTDISAGAKKYQEINRATFAENWADVLAEKPLNGDVPTNETLNPGQKRILVIDHHLPMADRDAGSVRMFHILNILHNLGHRVTFLPDNLADIPPYGDELRKRGIEVSHHPYYKSIRDYLERHGFGFDAVILSRCDFARKHIANVRLYAPQSRIIFDTVDLHFLRMKREADLTHDPALRVSAEEKKQQEYELVDQADETWVVSSFEQEILGKERPDKSVEIVSTIVAVPGSNTPFSLRHDFLFIGSFQHTPNIDAVLFFTHEVFPLVEPRLPGVKFYVIGDKAPPAVVALASENIIITGLQPDVRPYFDSVKLSIAPLRWGAGIKGKMNQSMGFGVPVVATTVAVEGMALTNREDVLIADTPREFARALIDLYESEDLWTRLSEKGIAKTKAMYSSEAAKKQLSRLFSDNHIPPSVPIRTRSESLNKLRTEPSIIETYSNQ